MSSPKQGNGYLKVLSVVGVFVGTAVGVGLCTFFFHNADEECDANLSFVTEDVQCNRVEYVLDKREYVVTRKNLEEYLLQEKEEGRLTRYVVYFRDLENGPLFGIHEKDAFVPASLLKLPVLLTYLKEAESTPAILDVELSFEWNNEMKLQQSFAPQETIEPGKTYTVRELLRKMIAYSDNASYEVLLQYLDDIDPDGRFYLDTMRELGIIEPTGQLVETLTPKSYASIFRALYNGSFLSPEYSNLALDFLSQSTFKDGLLSGLPEGIVVAHKFGERFGLPENQKELHDCGVVYYPGNPYLICVMVEGYEFPTLSSVIRNVSDMIYDEVDSRRL